MKESRAMVVERRKSRGVACFAMTLAVALSSGCGIADDERQGQPPAARQEEIKQEVPGKVVLAYRRYDDPDIAKVSFASPTIPGCSATMIGPNVMMTASHCGHTDTDVTFGTIRNDDGKQFDQEIFKCKILINAFPKIDLNLYWCEPNVVGGPAPGDKYGYLDIDASPVKVGQPVYGIWWNDVTSLSLPWRSLYSPGAVTSNTTTIWNTKGLPWEDQLGPAEWPIGISTDMWSKPGCSGSAQINPANHRIRLGPTSTSSDDAPGRNALSMDTLLRQGTVDGHWNDDKKTIWQTGLYDTALKDLGLTPGSYAGKVDKNQNLLFDVQENAERIHGENQRTWYFLGFESERRNALWDAVGGVTIDAVPGQADFSTKDGQVATLRHRGLHLKPNTTYRLSIMTNVASKSTLTPLTAAFQQEDGTVQDAKDVAMTIGAPWPVVTTTLRTAAQSPAFVLRTSGSLNASIAFISLVEEGAVMDFDSADQRINWKDENTGHFAILLPEGTTTGTPNWAGLVTRNGKRPLSDDWSLRNRQLALQASQTYRLCFDVKARNPAAVGVQDWGSVRATSGGLELMRVMFTPTDTWTTVCAPQFTPTSGDNGVMFGVATDSSKNGLPASYLVDNLQLQALTGVDGGVTSDMTGMNAKSDAQPAPDAGTNGGNQGSSGCGCTAGGHIGTASFEVSVLALLLLGLGLRRRSRSRT